MSDIREQLAHALHGHRLTDKPTWANERVCQCGVDGLHTLIRPGWEGHVADVLLSLPGIACVDRTALARVITGGIQSYAETYDLQKLNDDAPSITNYIFTNSLLTATGAQS